MVFATNEKRNYCKVLDEALALLHVLFNRLELLGRTCNEEVTFFRGVNLRLNLGGVGERDVHLAASLGFESFGDLGERIGHARTAIDVELSALER